MIGMNDDELVREFAEMAVQLHDEPGVEETVERVLEYALKAVRCSYAGVLFLHGGRRIESAAVTHQVVREVDTLQMELGEGPDLEVLSDEHSRHIPDFRAETRWPTWTPHVLQRGIHSMLSIRLFTSDKTVGTLNLYDIEPGAFDHDDRAVATVLARHAAVALSTARNEENLRLAVDARKLIGQAQGILMERYDLDADQAWSVLLRYSQDRNIKLRAVAERLVATRSLPD